MKVNDWAVKLLVQLASYDNKGDVDIMQNVGVSDSFSGKMLVQPDRPSSLPRKGGFASSSGVHDSPAAFINDMLHKAHRRGASGGGQFGIGSSAAGTNAPRPVSTSSVSLAGVVDGSDIFSAVAKNWEPNRVKLISFGAADVLVGAMKKFNNNPGIVRYCRLNIYHFVSIAYKMTISS